MSEPNVTGWDSHQELPNLQASQDAPHYSAVPVSYHSTIPPQFPHQFAVNNGHVPRRVNLGLRRVGNSTVNPKVPIPRTTPVEPPGKARAKHACKHCREQKAKCTGLQPCQRCYESGASCIYEVRKRDVLDRYVGVLIFHGHNVPCLLTT